MIRVEFCLRQFKKFITPHENYRYYYNIIQQTYFTYVEYHVDASYCPFLRCSSIAIISHNQLTNLNYYNVNGSIHAELCGLFDCIKLIVTTQLPGRYIIYNDSLEAIKRVMSAVAEYTLHQYDIVIVWIPSHVGIEGNEIADQHARRGLEIMRYEVNVINKDPPQIDGNMTEECNN